MVKVATGKPRREPGPLVPWGPARPQRRSHLWLGGNAQAVLQFDDADMAEQQRKLARPSMSIVVGETRLEGVIVRVKATVKNELIGHSFPAMETIQRAGWLSLEALDANGKVLATTVKPESETKSDAGVGLDEPGVMYHRKSAQGITVFDTTVPANGQRDFELRLSLGQHAAKAKRLRLALHQSFDPEPFVVVTSELRESSVR